MTDTPTPDVTDNRADHRFEVTIDGHRAELVYVLEGTDLPTADVTRLAKLPSREQMLGQLASGIASPLSGLAGGLSNLIGGLARTLGALQAQKAAE